MLLYTIKQNTEQINFEQMFVSMKKINGSDMSC